METYFATITIIGIATCFLVGTNGFLFKKTDCLVSEWSQWSAPYGFGTISRERKILRYPTNGGAACPAVLVEVNQTSQTPPLNTTAGNMIRYFIKRARLQKRQAVGQLRDLLVIVDSSGSITPEGFATGKTQLSRLLGMLCPVPNPFDSNYQRAALLQYSSTVQEIFDFNEKPSTNLVQQGINSMIYDAGITCTGDAFNYAYNNMFTTAKGMRTSPDVKQEVLIITDGQSNCGVNAIAAAANLQTKADVFGLMIGDHTQAGEAELTSYVSYPINTHLFAITGTQVLEQLVNLIASQLSNVPCAPFDIG